MEIGAHLGGGLYAWAATGADVIGISLPEDRHAARIPGPARMIWGDSKDPETRWLLRTWLDGRHPDMVFIDGDHSGPGCQADWELAIETGARMAVFHDIAGPHTPAVAAVYEQACQGRRHAEIIEPADGAEGTGIIWL